MTVCKTLLVLVKKRSRESAKSAGCFFAQNAKNVHVNV